jgi:hypothetical protein
MVSSESSVSVDSETLAAFAVLAVVIVSSPSVLLQAPDHERRGPRM